MNRLLLNISSGFALTVFLAVSGIALSPLFDFDSSSVDEVNELSNRKYNYIFDFHNISTFPVPINKLFISYLEDNSSLLNHSDPLLVAVWFQRDIPSHPEKSDTDNCTTWEVMAFPGLNYNQWNSCDYYATNNPPILVHDSYIAFEVMNFSQSILGIVGSLPNADLSQYNYSLGEQEGYNLIENYSIPNHWVFSATLEYENATSIVIDCHNDGWLSITKFVPFTWSSSDPYDFSMGCSGTTEYLQYDDNFDNFHSSFSSYANNHIFYVNTTLDNP